VPFLRELKKQKASAPGVKLSRLQRWILKAALEGVGTRKERAKLKREQIASMWKGLGGSPGLSPSVDRAKIAHLDRKQILAGYFGLTPGGAPRESWWRRWSCEQISHPAYRDKTVGELTPDLLAKAVGQWCPKVRQAWEKVTERTRKTYQAILEAWMEPGPKTVYNRANASICRALRRLRARGLLVPASDNSLIRLTPKGIKAARKLS
jgi:hypothetical protein